MQMIDANKRWGVCFAAMNAIAAQNGKRLGLVALDRGLQ
jgi:hypothetical protein